MKKLIAILILSLSQQSFADSACIISALIDGNSDQGFAVARIPAANCKSYAQDLLKLKCYAHQGASYRLQFIVDDDQSVTNDLVSEAVNGRCE